MAASPIPLNPRFAARAADIQRELQDTLNVISEPLARARLAVAELQDFLQFEVDKTKLAVITTPPAQIDKVAGWLDMLERTKALYSPEVVDETNENLQELCDILGDNFAA